MTTRTEVRTEHAPTPAGAYSQGIAINGLLFTAGMGPHDPRTGDIVGTTVEEQTAQVMRNLESLLAQRDLTFAHVVKATVHLADLRRDFRGFDATYRSVVSAPYPVRTTVGSVLAPEMLVEIDLVAALPAE